MDHHGRTLAGWRHHARVLFLVPGVLALSTCLLPSEPSSTTRRIVFGLPGDTAVVAVGGTMTPVVTVEGDGAWVAAPRVRFESLDTSIIAIDASGQLSARRRGVVTIRAVLVSGATGVTPPDTTFSMRVIIKGITLSFCDDSPPTQIYTLSLHDALPGAADAAGMALVPAPPEGG